MADARDDEVKRAILVALDWRSSGETRRAATSYLESLKNGDVHILAEVSYGLVRQQCPSEIRLYGFKMLQHLIRLRWEELKAPEEHLQMASMSLMMLEEIGKGHEQWALKSQAAALVAEVSRRGGVAMWNEILPSLFNLSANGPAHAELVTMVLRWLPEDVTVHNEDLEGERRRQLLFGLTQTLPQTLPFLFNLLELHFRATITLAAQNQEDLANQHAAAVTATLLAVIAFAEWAPVTAMVEYRLVEACSALQHAPQFRLSACEVLKLIASRRKPADETGNLFVLAMMNVFDALAQASEAFLMNVAQWTSALGEAMGNRSSIMNGIDVDYGECLCEAMVALGSHNFQCVADHKARVDVYIRKMLGFLQLPIYALHSRALPLWLSLLRDAVSTMNNSKGEADQIDLSSTHANGSALNSAEKDKKGIAYSLITTDYCAVLIDLAYQRLLVKNSESKAASEDEDFSTPVDYSQYHSRLLELIRLLSSLQPPLAVAKVAQEIDGNFVGDEFSQASPQTILTLESLQVMLEAVMNGIPENILAVEAASRRALGVLLEGIFERLYRVSWKAPALVELHGQYIDAMGSFLKHAQATFIQLAVDKLFVLLESLPVIRMNQAIDTAFAKGISRARLQVCTSFLRVAKAADSALLPHAMGIANRMTTMEAEGHLSRGEVNLLGEALLIVGSAGGISQQIQVLDWLLGPLRECWEQSEWQLRYLSSAGGLVDLVSGSHQIFTGKGTDGKSIHDQIWLVFHTVTFLERAYRRVGDFKKSKSNVVPREQTMAEDTDPASAAARFFPLVDHLKWILPPLLKLLRCIHALWSESIVATLPGEMRGALAMGVPELTSLLGTTLASSSEDGASQMEGTSGGGMGTKENEVRTWLKGIRDSAYNMLGIAAARLGGGFFDDTDGRAAPLATALVENIEYMEMHHVRQLIHSVIIFFVKACPRAQWGPWLGRMLPPILVHGQSVLSVSWASLLREGAVKPPKYWIATSLGSNEGSSKAIKTEVILEKLLRDLTREYCNLLSVIASPALSPRQQLPSGEHTAGAESSAVIGADSMLGFLMQHKEAALAALHIGIEALEWTDSDAVHKATPFCGAVVSMGSVLTEPELQDIVGQNMFPAAVRGLTLESNATAQAELIGLLREIYIRLASYSQAPRQLLLSLPSVTKEVLAAFEKALEKTASVKEQRQLMKTLLLAAGGDQLKALKAQKNMSVITNVTDRSLEGHRPGGGFSKPVDAGPLGLANIL